MKNPLYFAISVLVIVTCLITLFISEKMLPIGLLSFGLGLLLMIHWNTISYLWRCDECGEKFEIDMFHNFIGLNGGINHKYLNCPKCKKRTWCKGIPK